MRSISTATWLSLATGWLAAAAAVAVVAAAPDEAPGVELVPAPQASRTLQQQETDHVEAGLVGPHHELVTLATRVIR